MLGLETSNHACYLTLPILYTASSIRWADASVPIDFVTN